MLNEITLACYTQGHANQNINSETWCICELYCSFLKDFDTAKVEKCNVNIRDNWGDLLDYYEDYGDVVTIRDEFDFERYDSLESKFEKKRMQLECLHENMLQIAKKHSWEEEPLNKAYQNCIEHNLEYQFYLPKGKTSPNRKFKMFLWSDWDIDRFELFWVLKDKNGEVLNKELLVRKKPEEGEFVYYVKIKWLDQSNVLISDTYKYGDNELWEINIDDHV